MSVKMFSESAISSERTLVYQTVFENFVVLIQQKRKNDLWYTYQHYLIPKLFMNSIAALTEKTEPAESSIITSGGHLPPKTIPQMHSTEEPLPEEVRRILYRYDCDCVPLFENQLSTYQAYKNLVICGVSNHHHPHRTVSHRVFQSVFRQLLLWIQAQLLLQPQAFHSLRISRVRTRSLTILQIQVSLMSIFYLVQTFRHHNPQQIQPMSRHPIARKLQ